MLTPIGAERAGNAAGTVPAWTGGLTEPPSGWQPGDRLKDPYPNDPVLITITASNHEEYAELLTQGQKALLQKYPDTWFMNVYASRRSAAYPQAIYNAIESNADSAELISEDRGGVRNSRVTSPFPRPESGVEVVWNHNLRWRGIRANRMEGTAAVTRRGRYTLILQEDEWAFPYGLLSTAGDEPQENVLLSYKSKVIGPGFVSGNGLLTVDSLNHNETPRENWLYSPDLRRVLRAPFSGFDNPAPNTDALRFTDEGDMFNGSPALFDWTLLGKKEMYIPYNAYRLDSAELEDTDIVLKSHINPAHVRYELHRVWVVEGRLKDGGREHQYSRRVFYVDEDTWQIAAADSYDSDGKLWRVSEGHMVNFYEVPVPWYTLRVYHDLREERFLVQGLDNQRRATEFSNDINPRLFGPSALSFYVR
ncbi:MAG: DUF1329 domain-containing protein [Halioglobus sp.]